MSAALHPSFFPPRDRRVQLGLLLLTAIGFSCLFFEIYRRFYPSPDYGAFWQSTRDWLAGAPPYGLKQTPGTDMGRATFAYPFLALLFLTPFALVPLPSSVALWTGLSVTIYCSFPWLLRFQRPLIVALGSLLYFPLWMAIEQAQWSLVLTAIGGLIVALYAERPFWSGLLIPLLLLKPQVGIGLVCGLLAFNLPRNKSHYWIGALTGVGIWWGGTLLFRPTWPSEWLTLLQSLSRNEVLRLSYAYPYQTPGFGIGICGLLVGALLLALYRRHAAALCITTTLTVLMVSPLRVYDYLVLYVPLLVLLRHVQQKQAAHTGEAAVLPLYQSAPILLMGGFAAISWLTVIGGGLGLGLTGIFLSSVLPLVVGALVLLSWR